MRCDDTSIDPPVACLPSPAFVIIAIIRSADTMSLSVCPPGDEDLVVLGDIERDTYRLFVDQRVRYPRFRAPGSGLSVRFG